MIELYNFTWNMKINFEWICSCIEYGTYRKEGLKEKQIRKIYSLICQYADSQAEKQLDNILVKYPKAFTFLIERRKQS